MAFTNPYLESRMIFLMKKKFKHTYTSLASIIQNPRVLLVVKSGTAYEQLAKALIPASKIAVVDSYQEYLEDYPNDVLLRGEFQQISWSLTHPEYTVVFPEPQIAKDIFGYAVAQGSDKFLSYLNLWLDLKKNEQFADQQYDIWVLGQTNVAITPERRWSIIRNVLGWTEN